MKINSIKNEKRMRLVLKRISPLFCGNVQWHHSAISSVGKALSCFLGLFYYLNSEDMFVYKGLGSGGHDLHRNKIVYFVRLFPYVRCH